MKPFETILEINAERLLQEVSFKNPKTRQEVRDTVTNVLHSNEIYGENCKNKLTDIYLSNHSEIED